MGHQNSALIGFVLKLIKIKPKVQLGDYLFKMGKIISPSPLLKFNSKLFLSIEVSLVMSGKFAVLRWQPSHAIGKTKSLLSQKKTVMGNKSELTKDQVSKSQLLYN